MIGCIALLADFLWAILSTYSLGTFKVWQIPLLENVVGHGEREERGDLLSEAMGRELCFLHTTTATFPFFSLCFLEGTMKRKNSISLLLNVLNPANERIKWRPGKKWAESSI